MLGNRRPDAGQYSCTIKLNHMRACVYVRVFVYVRVCVYVMMCVRAHAKCTGHSGYTIPLTAPYCTHG